MKTADINVDLVQSGQSDATKLPEVLGYRVTNSFSVLVQDKDAAKLGSVNGGTIVKIAGSNFTGATTVLFGTTMATFIVNSSGWITAIAPPGTATGTLDITRRAPASVARAIACHCRQPSNYRGEAIILASGFVAPVAYNRYCGFANSSLAFFRHLALLLRNLSNCETVPFRDRP